MATNLGLQVDLMPGDWRRGADTGALSAKLADDRQHAI